MCQIIHMESSIVLFSDNLDALSNPPCVKKTQSREKYTFHKLDLFTGQHELRPFIVAIQTVIIKNLERPSSICTSQVENQ